MQNAATPTLLLQQPPLLQVITALLMCASHSLLLLTLACPCPCCCCCCLLWLAVHRHGQQLLQLRKFITSLGQLQDTAQYSMSHSIAQHEMQHSSSQYSPYMT
jgi:hypothetical protein